MIKGRDIIVVGLQPWDNEIGSNCKNIAAEFARHNRVLYVNYPLDRISIKREAGNPNIAKRIDIIKNNKENLFAVNENMWQLYPKCVLESANWIPLTPVFRLVNKLNNRRFANEIKDGIKRTGFKDYIIFNDSDMFRSYHLKEMLQPDLYVYYTRDNMMSVPYWYKHGHLLEPELMANSDAVTANSTYLAGIASQYNKHSYYVGQGCDVQDFDLEKIKSVPADIASIKRPIVGYIGALYELRLDLELLEALATKRPEWNIVLIGPEDEAFKSSRLHTLPNVHFLGLKDAGELPAYLARFDVAINPQILNEVTIGNYPRKIDEYLAMGKPTVATETKAMQIFAEHCYLAQTHEDYLVLIDKALHENSAEKENARIEFARSHTWENSVNEIYHAIENVMKK